MREPVAFLVGLFLVGVLSAQSPPSESKDHAPASEDVKAFDPRFVELQRTDNKWRLQTAGVVIKEFDHREVEAKEAIRIIRELQLTHYGTIGTPLPVMEYWLSHGQPPAGTTSALNPINFDPLALRLEQIQGNWYLRDARRIYFNFGQHPEDARRALEVIHKHGFNQIGFVGQPPVMLYFLASKSQGTPPPPFHNTTINRNYPQTQSLRPVGGTTTAQPRFPGAGVSSVPEQAALSERIPIDWRQVQVRQENQEWKLAYGSYVLANFGKSERDARQALTALRHYRVTEYCLVGRTPSFSYFLANGQAPRGVLIGMHSVSFRPEQLAIRQVGSHHILTDGTRSILNFGEKADEARQALEAIQRHRCDRLCHIGPANAKGLDLLVRTY